MQHLEQANKPFILAAIKTVIPDMKSYAGQPKNLNQWISWYQGKNKFHRYFVYNGVEEVEKEKKTLGMAKRVCEDWASLLVNEKLKININDNDQETLDTFLSDINFNEQLSDLVEKAFALSMGAIVLTVNNIVVQGEKVGVNKNADVDVSFLSATNVYPITIKNREVVECAFAIQETNKTIVVVHHIVNGKYVISTVEMTERSTEISDFYTNSDIPFFQVIYPNVANNANIFVEQPISIFANAIDSFKCVDNKYDGLDNEFILGRKKIFLATKMQNFEIDLENGGGKVKRTFQPNESVFYQLPDGEASDAGDLTKLIHSVSDDLRVESFQQGIQIDLNQISKSCGFGSNFYTFERTGVVTATQVISENSEAYRNRGKHLFVLERAIKKLTQAICYCMSTFIGNGVREHSLDEIQVLFDDSIIEDKGTLKERDKDLVSSGLLSVAEYRMKWFGEDEDTAKEKERELFISKNIIALVSQGLITPEIYVDMYFPNAPNKKEFVEYIKSNLTTQNIEDLDI